jgi:phthiodiolone/phenolphthiodiolone dimycocerosates ketoreductase
MAKIKYGSPGQHFPPADLVGQGAQFYESSGYDFVTFCDQLSLTIPRSIWTPDLVPAAEFWDIDEYMDPWPMMTAAALATTNIEIGHVATDTLRRLPANLAQLICTLSQFSQGRFWVTLGAGEIKQFKPYGIPREMPFGHLEESIKIIRLMCETKEPVSYEGPIWTLDNAIMRLEPYEGQTPPLLVAGGPGRALDIAARLGDGWTVYLPACGDADWYGEQVTKIKAQAEREGRDPEALKFVGVFMAIIEANESRLDELTHNAALRWDAAACIPGGETWDRWGFENPLGDFSYARDLIPMDWSREDALKIVEQVPPEVVRKSKICGSPESVAAQIQPYVDAGCNYVFLADYTGVVTSGDWGDSMDAPSSVATTFNESRRLNNIPVPT